MHLKKAKVSDKHLEMINFYRQMELAEICKIKPKWACGNNYGYRLNKSLNEDEGYTLFYVDINELINLASFGEMGYVALNPKVLFANVKMTNFRIAKVLDRWKKGGFIDPPEIEIDQSNRIGFVDGRHRTIAAFHIGEKEIPIMAHKIFANALSKKVLLNKASTCI